MRAPIYLILVFCALGLKGAYGQQKVDRRQMEDSVKRWIVQAEEALMISPTTSEHFAVQAHAYTQTLKDISAEAEVTFLLGRIYFFLHKDDLSLQAFHHSADLYLQLKDSVQAALSFNGAGNVYMQKKKNFTEALKRYKHASDLLVRDSVTAIRVLNNIGTLYNRTGRHEEALEMFQQVYRVAKHHKDLVNMSGALNNIGSVYNRLDNHRESVSYYRQSISISEAYNNFRGMANSLTNMAISLRELKDYETAEKALAQSLALSKQYGYADLEIYAYVILSELYAQMNKAGAGLDVMQAAHRLSRSSGVTMHNSSIYKRLSEMHHATDQLDSALFYEQKYGQLMDSLTRLERSAVTDLVAPGGSHKSPAQAPSESGWTVDASTQLTMGALLMVVVGGTLLLLRFIRFRRQTGKEV